MSNSYAMCDNTGRVLHIVKSPYYEMSHGKVMPDGLFAYELPPELTSAQALNMLCIEGKWTEKPPRPDPTYKWTADGWVPDVTMNWAEIRHKRLRLIIESDWTQLPDTPLTPEQKNAWATYRQELRDMPSSQPTATLSTIVWPTRPE